MRFQNSNFSPRSCSLHSPPDLIILSLKSSSLSLSSPPQFLTPPSSNPCHVCRRRRRCKHTDSTVEEIDKGGDQGPGLGVFFRDMTIQNARELGLNDWFRNRHDDTVKALFSDDPSAIDEMVEKRYRVGPPSAAVTALNFFPAEEDPG